ncbi:hypothetical protein [Paraburkholderia sp. MM5482-R1]|uniref:hypothetical protein n=1 Tax=unclassified Paraburkholderia TaxID=2615204 RepID=UPI003D1966A3
MAKNTKNTTTALDRFESEEQARAYVARTAATLAELKPLAEQFRAMREAFEQADAMAADLAEVQAALPGLKARDWDRTVDDIEIVGVQDAPGEFHPLNPISVTVTRKSLKANPTQRGDVGQDAPVSVVDLATADRKVWHAIAKQAAHLVPSRILEWGDGDCLAGIEAYVAHKRRGYVNQ